MTESSKAHSRLVRTVRALLSRSTILIFIVAALMVGYWIGVEPSNEGAEPSSLGESTHDHATSDEAAEVWSCAMHPQIRLSKPGQCPICGMDLVPVDDQSQQGMSGLRQFATTPEAIALMGVQTVPVRRDFADAEIRMVGKVDYDETRLAYITAWVPGRIDELFVDFTGIRVKKGDHLVSLYSPQVITAQEELWRTATAVSNLRESSPSVLKNTTESTMKAAREKLRRWGLSQEQIDAAETKGNVSDHITIFAPVGGTVIHRVGQEGMYVDVGMRIYTLADLDQMWVKLDAYESDLPWLKYGQRVEFTTESYAGKVFEGRVTFIDPFLDPKTRTAKVRMNVSNEEGLLKPEMFVSAVARPHIAMGGRVMDPEMVGKWVSPMHPEIVKDGPGQCDICGMTLVPASELGYVAPNSTDVEKPLIIPISAALVTGTRAIVYIEVPDADQPTFEGREIVLGPRAGDYYIVLAGLDEGEMVVVNGNFKIDSALQILAKPSMMTPEGGGGGGHDHGGMDMKPKAEKTAGAPMVKLDYRSKEQLEALWAADESVGRAVEQGEDAELITALDNFEKTIKSVDMALLEGHAHMVWMEFSRRLENDVVEASIAKDESDRVKVLASLSDNLAKLGAQLGLHVDHAVQHAMNIPEVSDEFQTSLTRVVDSYLGIQGALAADDINEAQAAALQLSDGLTASEGLDVAVETQEQWREPRDAAGAAARAIGTATDIESMRRDFERLTVQIQDIVQLFGVRSAQTLYVVHCPMAFESKGASWLQSTEEIHNPYFGKSMLTCGDIVDKITPVASEKTDTQGAEHASH